MSVSEFFGSDSPLASLLSGFSPRSAQSEMAEAIHDALQSERHLFVEAGTGTGKTLAYLIPAALSGQKVVVSTATRTLQEQLYDKDLPVVHRLLEGNGRPFRSALMKGLSNYVCLRRLEEARSSAEPPRPELVEWARKTERGDLSELSFASETESLRVASSPETRIGQGCAHFDACFVTRMRKEAEEADLVVVNHHLFLADLALRTAKAGGYASVLPNYDAVIFDEAHQLEDIATEFFGFRLSSARIDTLVREAERALIRHKLIELSKDGPVRSLLEQIRSAADAFFQALGSSVTPEAPRRVFLRADVPDDVLRRREKLEAALSVLVHYAKECGAESVLVVGRRAEEILSHLARFSEHGGDQITWLEQKARSVSIGQSPVNVGEILREHLFDRIPTVVCTSATLTTRGRADFVRARLGAPSEARELVVESPFDFASHAALYIARDLPEPSSPEYMAAAAQRAKELIEITGGGAFVLATSIRSMKGLYEVLRGEIPHKVLVQGEGPREGLLEQFRRERDAVLVATMSFWEGVDVPGHALRLVIVDKIPFAVPTDPVTMARCAKLDENGGNSFSEYSLPSAALTLKQGFGRLIRTETDVGVVAVLDRRLVTKSYGRVLVSSLPPATRCDSLASVRSFWDKVVVRSGA